VRLVLPMPVKASTCHKSVEANHDRIALTRGPLLLCAEGVDNGGAVQRFFVDPERAVAGAEVETHKEGVLKGLPKISVPASELTTSDVNADATLNLIPYFAWSNRDRSSMITWIGTKRELARLSYELDLKFADAKASHTFDNDTVNAIRMKHTPKSSKDTNIRRWTSWPQRGKPQWVEIDLGDAKKITSVGIYWYNDDGGVQLPASWHIETLKDDKWQKLAIYNTDSYSCLPDGYNTVQPADPLKTARFRIVMQPQHDRTCVGILSVDVETK